jgi:hypothetical protein
MNYVILRPEWNNEGDLKIKDQYGNEVTNIVSVVINTEVNEQAFMDIRVLINMQMVRE